MYHFDHKSGYWNNPGPRKQFLPLWSVTLHSDTKANVMVALQMPLTMNRDSIISACCTVLDTKHSRFHLSIIDSLCREETEESSRRFWKENCTCNTFWPQILLQRATQDKESQMSKRLNITQIWIFRFEFEFECGIYHTLFHSFGSKFNFDNNGPLTGQQHYHHDQYNNNNNNINSIIPTDDDNSEIEFTLNIKPWSMWAKTENDDAPDSDDETNNFHRGWIAFHFPHVLAPWAIQEESLNFAESAEYPT